MNRDQVMDQLRGDLSVLKERFGVKELALFGSTARGEATGSSDLDILVTFEGEANSKNYFGLLFYLEDAFRCKIDLVTSEALRPELKPVIEKELIHV